jgi:hypothetical protein
VQRLAPYLPFVVTRIGVELYLHTTVEHLLHDVARIFNAWVLLTTTYEEYFQLLVERLRIAEHAWYLFL